MTSPQAEQGKHDVPTQVFQQFLHNVEVADLSPELVARLRKTLIEEKTFTDRALMAAVFGEEAVP